MSSPPRTKRDIPPKLPSKKQQRSHSLTPSQTTPGGYTDNNHSQDKFCSGDGFIQGESDQQSSVMEICFKTRVFLGNGNVDHATQRPIEARRLNSTEKCNSADGVIQNNSSSGM